MPMNPETGTPLPAKGAPGYDEAKKQFPELYAAEEGAEEGPEMAGDEGPEDVAIPEGGIVPDRDLKPLMDDFDKSVDEGIEAEEGAEGAEDAEDADMDVGPMVEMLGVSKERAMDLLAAAKEIPKFAEMSVDDLAKAITEDFQILMELERVAAQKATGSMPEQAMAPAPMMGAPEPEMT